MHDRPVADSGAHSPNAAPVLHSATTPWVKEGHEPGNRAALNS